MAGRKLNEIDFILNAQMNSGFHGTFTKAQAEFAKLGGEIAELHKAQSNVAAYQKQQGAIAATEDKLANLKKQHALLQTEIDETTGSTASLSREKLKLEQRIKNAEDALTRQKQKLGATAEALKGAEISTDDLGEAQTRLSAQLAELTAQQEQAAKGALTFGEKTAQSFEAVQSAIAAAGIAAALHEIGGAYMDCITIAGDFQSSMSTVEALSGATANEMESLTAKAKEMGAATKFTAQEASEAMQYMSMAGWDAASMTAGLGGVMQLAAASGEELGTVSDIVTDALTAFGMTAQDTNRFVDILAAAATKSNTNVSMLGESFKYAAPPVRDAGLFGAGRGGGAGPHGQQRHQEQPGGHHPENSAGQLVRSNQSTGRRDGAAWHLDDQRGRDHEVVGTADRQPALLLLGTE